MLCLFQLRSVWLKDGAEEDCIVSINNEVMWSGTPSNLTHLIWPVSNQPNLNSVQLINRSSEYPAFTHPVNQTANNNNTTVLLLLIIIIGFIDKFTDTLQ